eukprot:356036-Chlamydomonas_euryale.AAC.5
MHMHSLSPAAPAEAADAHQNVFPPFLWYQGRSDCGTLCAAAWRSATWLVPRRKCYGRHSCRQPSLHTRRAGAGAQGEYSRLRCCYFLRRCCLQGRFVAFVPLGALRKAGAWQVSTKRGCNGRVDVAHVRSQEYRRRRRQRCSRSASGWVTCARTSMWLRLGRGECRACRACRGAPERARWHMCGRRAGERVALPVAGGR